MLETQKENSVYMWVTTNSLFNYLFTMQNFENIINFI